MGNMTLADLILHFYDQMSSWEINLVHKSGVTLQQTHALVAIGEGNSVRMKDLASRLGITMGTGTVLVRRLLDQGLVQQTPNPQDARSHLLNLTVKGLKVVREHLIHHQALGEEIVALLGKKDSRTLANLLEKIHEVFPH
ncbi:MAG TPA: MarR family winged helix-turn-helix transcriptional regulator [Fibrobacteraceae bacterium]|nr:MarR family winged helix-turn-helix transcriptional regulator [Fibrobacteraceae bacterium]